MEFRNPLFIPNMIGLVVVEVEAGVEAFAITFPTEFYVRVIINVLCPLSHYSYFHLYLTDLNFEYFLSEFKTEPPLAPHLVTVPCRSPHCGRLSALFTPFANPTNCGFLHDITD